MRCDPVISKRFTIATAWPGADGTISGRNWEVWVGVTGDPHPDSGMILSLSDVKGAMQGVMAQVDHWHLPETPLWDEHPTMSDWLHWWWEASLQALAGYSCHLHHVYVSSAHHGGWVAKTGRDAFRYAPLGLDTPLARVPVRLRYPEDVVLDEALSAAPPSEWLDRCTQAFSRGQLAVGNTAYEWVNGCQYIEEWQEWSGPHRLYRPDWTNQKNEACFGGCTRLHGHTFRVGITVPRSDVATIPTGVLAPYEGALGAGQLTLEALVSRLVRDHPHVVRWRVHETEGNRVSCRRVVPGPQCVTL